MTRHVVKAERARLIEEGMRPFDKVRDFQVCRSVCVAHDDVLQRLGLNGSRARALSLCICILRHVHVDLKIFMYLHTCVCVCVPVSVSLCVCVYAYLGVGEATAQQRTYVLGLWLSSGYMCAGGVCTSVHLQ